MAAQVQSYSQGINQQKCEAFSISSLHLYMERAIPGCD